MKHDPRHIILIPLLAIIMAACSDTPLPSPAPAPGDTATVIFSLNLNSSSPTASRALSRAETTETETVETEEILLSDEERVFGGWEPALQYTFSNSVFTENEPVAGGYITATVKDIKQNNKVEFFINGTGYPQTEIVQVDDIYSLYRYQIKDTDVELLKKGGLKVMAYYRTVTQITYTAKKAGPVGPDPIDPGLLWKDEYNPGDEDAADCVIDPDKLHLLIYDSDTEKLIAWVNGVRLTDQSGDDRHYGGELSISLEAFKEATGGTRIADGTTTSNAAGVTESVNEVTVIALANWSASVVTPLLTAESTIAQLEEKAAAFDWNAGLSAKDNGYIPMWGQSRIHVDFSTDNLANLLDIKLLRSLAKVKIMLKDDAALPRVDHRTLLRYRLCPRQHIRPARFTTCPPAYAWTTLSRVGDPAETCHYGAEAYPTASTRSPPPCSQPR